jgi:mono/diheme cytochrome c family protein
VEGVERKWYGGILAFFVCVALCMAEPGYSRMVGNESRSQQAPPSLPSLDRMQQGQALYEGLARCVHCHGHRAVRRSLTDQELFSIIKFGVPGTSHIPYTHLLSDDEIWSIVHYQLHETCKNGCRD